MDIEELLREMADADRERRQCRLPRELHSERECLQLVAAARSRKLDPALRSFALAFCLTYWGPSHEAVRRILLPEIDAAELRSVVAGNHEHQADFRRYIPAGTIAAEAAILNLPEHYKACICDSEPGGRDFLTQVVAKFEPDPGLLLRVASWGSPLRNTLSALFIYEASGGTSSMLDAALASNDPQMMGAIRDAMSEVLAKAEGSPNWPVRHLHALRQIASTIELANSLQFPANPLP